MEKYESIARIRIQQSLEAKRYLENQVTALDAASDFIVDCFNKGNRLYVFGNGGSAADSQHIAGELVGRYLMERRGLPVVALTTDTSILTAWSNDYDFESVFERQVGALARKGDVLFGISTSGNSKNVIKALRRGTGIGTTNISLTGRLGGEVKDFSDININIPIKDTPRIQEAHMLAYHIICELVENKMFAIKEE